MKTNVQLNQYTYFEMSTIRTKRATLERIRNKNTFSYWLIHSLCIQKFMELSKSLRNFFF